MRWFGIVYTPLMAVLGLLFIVMGLILAIVEGREDGMSYIIAGSILSAGACISGALRGRN